MPVIAPLPSVEHGDVPGDRDAVRGKIERVQIRVGGAAVGIAQLLEGDLEIRARLDERQHAPFRAVTPSPAADASGLVRPRLVAECDQPFGPEKSTSLRAASAGRSRCVASWSISCQPAAVIGASERSR